MAGRWGGVSWLEKVSLKMASESRKWLGFANGSETKTFARGRAHYRAHSLSLLYPEWRVFSQWTAHCSTRTAVVVFVYALRLFTTVYRRTESSIQWLGVGVLVTKHCGDGMNVCCTASQWCKQDHLCKTKTIGRKTKTRPRPVVEKLWLSCQLKAAPSLHSTETG